MNEARFEFIEQDDECMYFRVWKGVELQGTIYIGKVQSLKGSTNND